MTDKDFAVLVAAISGLAGVALGIVGTLIASATEFKRQNDERHKTELREGYKKTWLLFNAYERRIKNLSSNADIALEFAEPGQRVQLSLDYNNKNHSHQIEFDQALLHLLVYMPEGDKTQQQIQKVNSQIESSLPAFLDTVNKEEQELHHKKATEAFNQLIPILQSVQEQAIRLIHEL